MQANSRSRRLKLSADELALLRQVVTARRPEVTPWVNRLENKPLSEEEREELQQALLEELLETGLSDDDEPNARGRELDELIGKLAQL